jgi:hypothetical protein
MAELREVRALHPMRLLLVSDDSEYANSLVFAAASRGVLATVVPVTDDVEDQTRRIGADAVVFDGGETYAPILRLGSAFAAVHPRIAVGIVANRVPERSAGNLLVMDRWRSAERLLGELDRARIGLDEPTAGGTDL